MKIPHPQPLSQRETGEEKYLPVRGNSFDEHESDS
jgi:hypothetical protein